MQSGLVVPPTMQRSIGDVPGAHKISWKYYGGSFDADATASPFNGSYCNICNPFEYQANYPSMVADHMRDVTDLFVDLKNGTPPAVSYVKPDGTMDGHPVSSKWTLFESFAKHIIELAQGNPEQSAETAIFVTVDEGGGFYDSGFIQPVDFFGTGPRIPMIAVSLFSTGGHVSHTYSEHSSFVKFIERNWRLRGTLRTTPTSRATCRPSATCSTCSTLSVGGEEGFADRAQGRARGLKDGRRRVLRPADACSRACPTLRKRAPAAPLRRAPANSGLTRDCVYVQSPECAT